MFLAQQTSSIYSQILDTAISNQSWGVGHFSRYYRREIGGNEYLYRNVSLKGKVISISLGRYDAALHTALSNASASDRQAESLVAMYNSDPMVPKLHAPLVRLIEVASDFGVFRSGGVLVGSNALYFYTNMLGFRFDSQAMQTTGVDISADNEYTGPSLAILVSDNGDKEPLEAKLLMKGFDKILSLDHKEPATSFTLTQQGARSKLDLLCPMRGAPSSSPIFIKSLRAHAEPVRFMEYLLPDAQLSVLVNGAGTLVRVPDPSRFALHKLVVSERRPASLAAKSMKDVSQADILLDHLLTYRPNDVSRAWHAAQSMGEKFITQMQAGLRHLPDIEARLYSLVSMPGDTSTPASTPQPPAKPSA